MASLLTFHSAKAILRGASTTILPTSTAATHILIKAGFDTPIATANNTYGMNYGGNSTVNMSTSSSTSGSGSCPIAAAGSNTSSVTHHGTPPSIFTSSNRCPCGMYPANGTPLDCPSSRSSSSMKSSYSIKPTTNPVRFQARAFSTVSATTSTSKTSSSSQEVNQISTEPASVPSESQTTTTTGTSTTAPACPLPPPPISLPSAFSAAHSSLLAIEDYRDGIQALTRGSLVIAKQLLTRTKDIVQYVPSQPYLAMYVKHLLASIAEREGKWKEERLIRSEILKELEKQWGKGPASASAVKEAELILVGQMKQSFSLACLRSDSRGELRQMIEAWLPRLEALLFGRPPSPVSTPSADPTTAPRHGSHSTPQAFSTGATHLKLLSQYLTLIEVGLFERTTRRSDSPVAFKQPIFERSIGQLGRLIQARPHLRSSLEWKLFQGELLMLPTVANQLSTLPGLEELIPIVDGQSLVTSTTSAVQQSQSLVRYFESHPELQRVSLSESHMVRDWYSPLVHSYLLATSAMFDPVTGALIPTDEKAAAMEPKLKSPPELLSVCLSFIEHSISSDPSHPILLRTLFQLALQSVLDGDAIQSEGLLRNILGKLEVSLGLHEPTVHIDSNKMALYLDALLEYVYLLTKLQWNNRSRLPEARSVFHQKLIRLIQKDPSIRPLIEILRPTARRVFTLPSPSATIPQSSDEITDDALSLPLNPQRLTRVPDWFQQKLATGTGLSSN